MRSGDPTQLLKPWGSGAWGWHRAATTCGVLGSTLSESYGNTFRPVPNKAGTHCLLSPYNLPYAGHLGYSPSPGPVPTLQKMSLGWEIPTHGVMHCGEQQGRCYIWRLGLWHHFSSLGGTLCVWLFPCPSPSPSRSDCVGHQWQQHHTATGLSWPLGCLNFSAGNYVLAKNNLLIKCPLEPEHSGAVTLQKKREV